MRKQIKAKVVVHKNEPVVELFYNHNGDSSAQRYYKVEEFYSNRDFKHFFEMSDDDFKKCYKEKKEALEALPRILEIISDIPENLNGHGLHNLIFGKTAERLRRTKKLYGYMEMVKAIREYKSKG